MFPLQKILKMIYLKPEYISDPLMDGQQNILRNYKVLLYTWRQNDKWENYINFEFSLRKELSKPCLIWYFTCISLTLRHSILGGNNFLATFVILTISKKCKGQTCRLFFLLCWVCVNFYGQHMDYKKTYMYYINYLVWKVCYISWFIFTLFFFQFVLHKFP